MTEEMQSTPDFAKNMYLLSFIDVSDRLDILLLEVRHLQQSIIDSLHSPTLLLPLRYEESVIFGGWLDELEKGVVLPDIATIASRGVIRYPSPKASTSDYYHPERNDSDNAAKDDTNRKTPKQIRKHIKERLKKRVGQVWMEDLWSRSERRNYHALRALQILKQQIFKDKVCLFRYAKSASLLNYEKDYIERKLSKPAFMIAKRGIMKRVRRYIAILHTHQQSFGKSLDFGLQRYPRPSIERRREIGIFNDYLSNRSRDIQYDMLHLVKSITKKKHQSEDDARDKRRDMSMLFHGWSQSMKVGNTQLYDDVGRYSSDDDDKYQDVSYVDTSIWSPDRPDLQPLIAREVARSIIKSRLMGLNETYLSNKENDLTDLMVRLSRILMDGCEDIKLLNPLQMEGKRLIYSIAQDLLAASVKGAPYLYALYLDIVGDGLEKQLKSQTGIRLDIAFDLDQGAAAYHEDYMWYFRLRLTAFWVKMLMQTHEKKGTKKLLASFNGIVQRHSIAGQLWRGGKTSAEDSPVKERSGDIEMNRILFEGVDQVCEEILTFLDTNTPKMRHSVGHRWRDMTEQMMNEMLKSPMLEKVIRWRDQRTQDSLCEKMGEDGQVDYKSGDKVYHRSTMNLDVRVQNYLIRLLIKQKQENGKPLSIDQGQETDSDTSDFKEQVDKFVEYYGFQRALDQNIPYIKPNDESSEKNRLTQCYQPRHLFQKLHDIPYQCALLRSMDLLGSIHSQCSKVTASSNDWAKTVEVIHDDMNLGRDLFSLGLEFYTWRRDSPKSRLLSCINLIAFVLPVLSSGLKIPVKTNKLRKSCVELVTKLKEWMYVYDVHDSDLQQVVNYQTKKIKRDIENDRFNHGKLQRKAVGNKGDPIKSGFIENYSAVAIKRVFFAIEASDSCSVRRLEQFAGYKLKHLLKILKTFVQEEIFESVPYSVISTQKTYQNYIDELRCVEETAVDYIKTHDTLITDSISQLGSLYAFLKIRDEHICPSSDHYFYELIFEAIGARWPEYNDRWELPKVIKPIMVSRMSITNFYKPADILQNAVINPDKVQVPSNAYNFYQIFKRENWIGLPSKSNSRTRYLTTLGRYDVVGLTPVRLPCKCAIPRFFDINEGEGTIPNEADLKVSERFVSHFSRREVAWEMGVYGECDLLDTDYQIMSIVSLSLQRRAMRLNIIHRLLDAVRNFEKPNDCGDKEQYAQTTVENYLQKLLKESGQSVVVKALLTDGWGDLLLVFLYKDALPKKHDAGFNKCFNLFKKGQLLENFFNLQNSLYEDFMVDRTEMIYTPQCLDAMAYHQAYLWKKKKLDAVDTRNYRFYFSIRFQDDRKLERIIKNFIATLERKLTREYLAKKNLPWLSEVTIFDMPGAYDLRIYFRIDYAMYCEAMPEAGIYQAIIDWLQDIDKEDPAWIFYINMFSVIDKIETGIERFSHRYPEIKRDEATLRDSFCGASL
jgi:hypothetical protein